ncbi:hypothetical protein BGZ61DRAFT_352459 [Ilyonectria robusta]|uniref:uncharacterized protein n=1 Tax=Ilyonectria robusta TaxID=1079257 RepID=UPI001E8E506C|nr:uncharacterized protein BGZ61DRAFT_352459 [Ilyonectria robusta]KAH8694730.1 hypothetical protein BGZ61DRAFT_352459 [Ilyonectria robusta]
MSYTPVSNALYIENSPGHNDDPGTTTTAPSVPTNWHDGPLKLRREGFVHMMGLVWDFVLTLVPVCFFALSYLALWLEAMPLSPYGQKIMDITLLGPTIYPILFAAIASRFYRNIARWCLEKQGGIKLAVLEQIFGSQSLAGALERFFVVRAQVLIGLLVLLTWALSPIGGQSAARLVYKGENITQVNGTVYYSFPNYQQSGFIGSSMVYSNKVSVNTLYLSSLLSSIKQKRSARDLWDLPRIPQWLDGQADGKTYDVDHGALARGDNHYASLLGVTIQGLDFASGDSQYNFTIESSYFHFDCGLVGTGIHVNESSAYFPRDELDPTTFVTFPTSREASPDLRSDAAGYMLYATLDWSNGHESTSSYMAVFNCSMHPTILATDIQCSSSPSSTTCRAQRQRRVNDQYTSDNFPLQGLVVNSTRKLVLDNWRNAEGPSTQHRTSPTDRYIAGDPYPFAAPEPQDWAKVNLTALSRRLATAFNTYWEATFNPLNRTNVMFRKQPQEYELSPLPTYMNSTDGIATTRRQAMAIAGFALGLYIRGPDILGFASSMTRDNPHIDIPTGGSSLDGPDRARTLGQLRVQLTDIFPEDESGYIALRTVPSAEQTGQPTEDGEKNGVWKKLSRKRLYL